MTESAIFQKYATPKFLPTHRCQSNLTKMHKRSRYSSDSTSSTISYCLQLCESLTIFSFNTEQIHKELYIICDLILCSLSPSLSYSLLPILFYIEVGQLITSYPQNANGKTYVTSSPIQTCKENGKAFYFQSSHFFWHQTLTP